MKDILRYCKKYIAYFLVVFLFSFLISSCDIKAANLAYNLEMETPILSVNLYNCTSANCSTYTGIPLENTSFISFLNSSSFTPNKSYGLVARVAYDQLLLKDYTYSISLPICFNGSNNFSSSDNTDLLSVGSSFNFDYPVKYINRYTIGLGSLDFIYDTDNQTFDNCRIIQYAFTNVRDSSFVNIPIAVSSSSSSSMSKYNFTILTNGTLDNLGYSSTVSNEEIKESLDTQYNEIKQEMSDLNDSINNSDSSGASDSAGGFFEDFTTDTFGLTAVITAPLNFIKSLTSSSCTPLNIPLPFVDTNLTLPCMSTIYNQYFGGFYALYQTITTGLIAYWVCVRIFNLVKDFKNPDHDEIEVMDL